MAAQRREIVSSALTVSTSPLRARRMSEAAGIRAGRFSRAGSEILEMHGAGGPVPRRVAPLSISGRGPQQ